MALFTIDVESQPLFDESEYFDKYLSWLHSKEIKDFWRWQFQNWEDGKLQYEFDPYKHFSQQEWIDSLCVPADVFAFERYVSDEEKDNFDLYGTEEFPVNPYIFWKAYQEYDDENLSELTCGEFNKLEDDYKKYLSSLGYVSYDSWKNLYSYETQNIVLENTGAFIRNATLQVYVFYGYHVKTDRTSYSYGLDLNSDYITQYYIGSFDETLYNYDETSNTFSLEYVTEPCIYNDESSKFSELYDTIYQKLKTYKPSYDGEVLNYYSSEYIYFCISYIDIDKQEQTEWYIYIPSSQKLDIINTYKPNVDEPYSGGANILSTDYRIAHSKYIAQCLGYSNSQRRRADYFDESEYIEQAEADIFNDLDVLMN